ncbi:sortase domain-containing protein [Streptomyces griseocarneus]|uniref:sortase domain-containing protein n=1 Tax=Streptomyces griseocarneus TaxID=51201 RepID=UPI00167D2FA5|nr:sortase [Streptomyces griseocarneus]MBZ6472261.1 sortase [Streptomyces griseocarneus]
MSRVSRRTLLPALGLLSAVAAALLAACAPGGGTDKVIGGPARAEEPSRVSIPSIGVDSPLIRLTRNKDGSVRVPPPEKGMTAGWYTGSAQPGTPGAAVIVGHSDSHGGKAVFHDLDKVGEGTVIDIRRGDGAVLHFAVTGTEKATGGAFPAHKVYGETKERVLRLVTCAGEPSAGDGHRAENLIVYATLKP